MWAKIKRWWKGYTTLQFCFKGGHVVEVRVTDWKVERHNVNDELISYNITYHSSNKTRLLFTSLKSVECVVEVK